MLSKKPECVSEELRLDDAGLHRQGIEAGVGQSEKRIFEGWLSFSGLHDATFSI